MHRTTIRLNSFLFLLSLLFLPGLAASQTEVDYLLPQEAFRLSTAAESPDEVRITWQIADGYYLYRSKIKLTSETPGITLGNAQFPAGKIKQDQYFGDMEVYRDQVSIVVPIERTAAAGPSLNLLTVSQGCADAGLCYPPQKEKATIQLPPQAAAKPTPALSALSSLGQSLGLGQDDEILTPDQAYQLSAQAEGPDQIRLIWQIADGTYLYQDKIEVTLESGNGIEIAPYQLPQAEIKQNALRPDGSYGDLPVYHNEINLPLTLLRTNRSATDITIKVGYQGCAEAGVCYPPIRK
ncbi:MAG: protein-disulfide reductase DsbD family protein, partial [Sedimenticola sp.]|nr:protein-disulfide reductase DsbD family protein [Sedimenticola sp.]